MSVGAVVATKTTDYAWAAFFVGLGLWGTVRSARILWRWHHAYPNHKPREIVQPGAENRWREEPNALPAGSFVDAAVAWAPGTFFSGLSSQLGWVVVRPGWVAFLPTERSANLIGQMAWAAAGVGWDHLERMNYDLDALYKQGLHEFDRIVLETAEAQGRVIQSGSGDVLRPPSGAVLFRLDEKNYVQFPLKLPALLLAPWRVGAAMFKPAEMAKLFAAFTALPFAIGAIAGVVAWKTDQPTSDIYMGVGFWWSLVIFGWLGFFYVWHKHRKASQALR